MKYIRTKDGKIFTIVEKIDKTKFNHSYKYLYRIKEVERSNSGGDIIVDINVVKVADTIKELCDEFVGIDSQGHYIIHNDEFMEGARIIPLEEVKYYGAIWTEWGLKYIAKMNEKGTLELL